MRPIAPSSRLRFIQSSCPSVPATNPSTLICSCRFSLPIVDMLACPVSWSHTCVESAVPKSTLHFPQQVPESEDGYELNLELRAAEHCGFGLVDPVHERANGLPARQDVDADRRV